MSRSAIRAKAKRDVESRFPHGTVAFVIVGSERDLPRRFAFRLCHGGRGIADLHREAEADGRICVAGILHQIIPSRLRVQQEVTCNFAIASGFVFQALRSRAISEVVVARKPGGSGEVRITVPGFIILAGIGVRLLQPAAVFMTSRFVGLVHLHDH